LGVAVLEELKKWLEKLYWTKEQVAGWVNTNFVGRIEGVLLHSAQTIVGIKTFTTTLIITSLTAATMKLVSTGTSGRDWVWQTAATGSTASGTTAGDVYLYDNTAGAYRVKVGSTGVMTVPGGIAFANETLSTYDEGSHTPVMTGSVSDPTFSGNTFTGNYTRIGNVVFLHMDLSIGTLTGAGGGTLYISLPFVAANYNMLQCAWTSIDVPGTPIEVFGITLQGLSKMQINTAVDNAAQNTVTLASLSSNDAINITGFYFV
jgi:hypothetical protein